MVAEIHAKELKRLQECVRQSKMYFESGYRHFEQMRKFIFSTSVTDAERNTLQITGKPEIEANVLEAYLSRLLGEFSKQEPSISVSSDFDANVPYQTIELVEGHFRHILDESNKSGFEYRIYRDMLSGGFSVGKVWTDYEHDMSLKQVIKFDRVFDPLLTGFDPLARAPHKGDGNYCFELYPKREQELKDEGVDTSKIKFIRAEEGFSWSYTTEKEKIALLCDFYEFKSKKIVILEIADNPITGPRRVITMDEYNKMLDWFKANNILVEPPAIIGKPRKTQIKTVHRYVFCESEMISHTETNFRFLPLVFFDGNSVILQEGNGTSSYQKIRSYFYQAIGTQRLKNFAMQCLGNELENMVQHKFLAAQESLPDSEEWLAAWKNFQVPSNMIYKAYKDLKSQQPLPPPTPIPRVPPPPEVMNTFMSADQTIQSILGSYDAALGINNNQLSGKAIMEGSTQSNAASLPYNVGFLQGLNQMAVIALDLIPKYLNNHKSIPIIQKDGKSGFRDIDKGTFEIPENVLKIRVESGVNYQIEKNRSLNFMIQMAQAIPSFGEFVNAKALPIVIKNMPVHGSDQLVQLAEEWQKEMQQQKQMQMQMAMENNPMELKKQELQIKNAQREDEKIENAAKIGLDQMRVDNERLRIMAEMGDAHAERMIKQEKHDTENYHAATDLAIKAASEHSHHHRELKKLEHEIMSATKHQE